MQVTFMASRGKISTRQNAKLPRNVCFHAELSFIVQPCLRFVFLCSILRSVDLSTTTTDSKQFQELLLERTKAFAAQTEALKSSNSDGKFSS